jgi:hypothetical protein
VATRNVRAMRRVGTESGHIIIGVGLSVGSHGDQAI